MAETLNGRICPMDHVALGVNDDLVVCGQCGRPHHRTCWTENRGCTTPECRGNPQRVVVFAQESVDVVEVRREIEDLRAAMKHLDSKVDQVIAASDNQVAEAVSAVRDAIEQLRDEQSADKRHVTAQLAGLDLRLRSVDLAMARRQEWALKQRPAARKRAKKVSKQITTRSDA